MFINFFVLSVRSKEINTDKVSSTGDSLVYKYKHQPKTIAKNNYVETYRFFKQHTYVIAIIHANISVDFHTFRKKKEFLKLVLR